MRKGIRKDDGTIAEGSLSLLLKDFAIPPCFVDIPEADQNRRIEISYQALTKYLDDAETRYELMREDRGVQLELPAGRKET